VQTALDVWFRVQGVMNHHKKVILRVGKGKSGKEREGRNWREK